MEQNTESLNGRELTSREMLAEYKRKAKEAADALSNPSKELDTITLLMLRSIFAEARINSALEELKMISLTDYEKDTYTDASCRHYVDEYFSDANPIVYIAKRFKCKFEDGRCRIPLDLRAMKRPDLHKLFSGICFYSISVYLESYVDESYTGDVLAYRADAEVAIQTDYFKKHNLSPMCSLYKKKVTMLSQREYFTNWKILFAATPVLDFNEVHAFGQLIIKMSELKHNGKLGICTVIMAVRLSGK
jgi:hypothetical protein